MEDFAAIGRAAMPSGDAPGLTSEFVEQRNGDDDKKAAAIGKKFARRMKGKKQQDVVALGKKIMGHTNGRALDDTLEAI